MFHVKRAMKYSMPVFKLVSDKYLCGGLVLKQKSVGGRVPFIDMFGMMAPMFASGFYRTDVYRSVLEGLSGENIVYFSIVRGRISQPKPEDPLIYITGKPRQVFNASLISCKRGTARIKEGFGSRRIDITVNLIYHPSLYAAFNIWRA